MAERSDAYASAFLAVISAEDSLGEVEDELFRFARLVESDPELRNAFSDRAMPLSARQGLVSDLLASRAGDATVALARRAVVARERTFAHTIEGYVDLAAAQKNRVVATVRVARPMDDDQKRRLQAALAASDVDGRVLPSSDSVPIRSSQVSNVIWVIIATGVGLLVVAVVLRAVRRVRGRGGVPADGRP